MTTQPDRHWLPWEQVWSEAGQRLFVERQTEQGHTRHRFRSDGPAPGAAVIATRLDRVLFIEIRRPAIERVLLELPRGQGEQTDASPLATGVRELQEETGYVLEQPRTIGHVYPDSGLSGDYVHIVVGDVAERPRDVPETGERYRCVWLTGQDIDLAIRAGAIRDAISLAALRHLEASEQR